MYLKLLHLVINYALDIENPSYTAQSRLKNINFIVFSRPSSSQIWHLKGLRFQHMVFMAPNTDLIWHGHSSIMSVPICLAGKKKKGIRESGLSLPHCHFFKCCIILSKSLTSVGLWVCKTRDQIICKEPRQVTRQQTHQRPCKEVHIHPRQMGQRPSRSSPKDQSLTRQPGEDEAAPCSMQTSKSSYWHHDVFPPLCFMLLQKEMSFFNLSLCNTLAFQAGPICSAKLWASPYCPGRGALGPEHP